MKFLIDGQEAQMDVEDALRYVGVPLYVNANGYLRGRGVRGKGRDYVHREIVGAADAQLVDHINGDRLDNRRENLRIVTAGQNCMNSGLRSNNSSGTRGVHFCKTRLRWVAQIKVGKKSLLLGRFQTQDEAVAARRAGERQHYGEFARVA